MHLMGSQAVDFVGFGLPMAAKLPAELLFCGFCLEPLRWSNKRPRARFGAVGWHDLALWSRPMHPVFDSQR